MSKMRYRQKLSIAFGQLQPIEMKFAIGVGLISLLLAFGSVLFAVHVLRKSLMALQGEETINPYLVLAMTESVWIHTLIVVTVLSSVALLCTRTSLGLIISAIIGASLVLYLVSWLGQISNTSFMWPHIGGPNFATLLLFITLLIRVIGEVVLIIRLVRIARARTAQ